MEDENKVIDIKEKENKVTEKKEKHGINKTLIIGILMLLIGAGGLYAMMYFFPIMAPNNNATTTTSSNGVTATEVKNVTVTDTGLADAVAKVYDAVVVVKTYVKGQLYATGTGFVYKKDGDTSYILTNNHVVSSGDTIYVVFTNGKSVQVEVKGKDTYSDIAVLAVDSSYVTSVASIGSSEDARVGDTVFTVGAPINSDTYSGTVTRGILSGKNRLVSVSLSTTSTSTSADLMMSVLQTDAAINAGNSGGPLCNANGEVIGITSMKLNSTSIEGMGFAIPVETAINYATKLETGEAIERPQLGITMRNLSEAVYYHYSALSNIGISSGVYVETVTAGGPAANGGIQSGDIITSIDDKDVSSIAYLRYILYNHSVGDTIKIKVYRNGDYKDITITLTQKASA